ncbi:hypothetical protein ACFY19_19225 [Streptosporangium saharense]|uniref:hypothetical protein n=1 Tax=Streptosporangium saharense TaxID=1706840 RepID=UPI0036CA8C72
MVRFDSGNENVLLLSEGHGTIRLCADFALTVSGGFKCSGPCDRPTELKVHSLVFPHDIPLGPFEGFQITLLATSGKRSRFHSDADCSALRGSRPAEQTKQLDQETLERLCTRCCAWGRWAPEGSTLRIFVDAVSGIGLSYELSNYLPESHDDLDATEITDAAKVLHRRQHSDEDDDAWNALKDARELRDALVREWQEAVTSLVRAHKVIGAYPWIVPWAKDRLTIKAEYAEVLRERAARLLLADDLVEAARVWALERPDTSAVPSVPGVPPSQMRSLLTSLWSRWHRDAMDEAYGLDGHSVIAYFIARDQRVGRDTRRLLEDKLKEIASEWRALATDQRPTDSHRFVAVLLDTEREHDSRRETIPWSSEWQVATLLHFTIDAAWEHGALLLRVPSDIAERLLKERQDLDFRAIHSGPDENPTSAFKKWVSELPEPESGPLPGVLDDGPVSSRRILTLSTVEKALGNDWETGPCVVFSPTHGVETLMPSTIARRCTNGWHGVLVTSATDLPNALVKDWLERTLKECETNPDDWRPSRRLQEDGERLLAHWGRSWKGLTEVERDLRILALARGVPDLRVISTVDDRGYSSIPQRVWHALLSSGQLNLTPFRKGEFRQKTLNLPLGVLATVQVYTSKADSEVEGRAHTPFCQHTHGTLINHFDLLSLREFLALEAFDACGKCGGYVVRRLTADQERYYRNAHRLTDIYQDLDRMHGQLPGLSPRSALKIRELSEELNALPNFGTADADFSSFSSDHWQWSASLRIVRELSIKLLKAVNTDYEDSEPSS